MNPTDALRSAYHHWRTSQDHYKATDVLVMALDSYLRSGDMINASQLLDGAYLPSLPTQAITGLCSVGAHGRHLEGFSESYENFVERMFHELAFRGVDNERLESLRRRFALSPTPPTKKFDEVEYYMDTEFGRVRVGKSKLV